jgi:tRNA 2-thiouridine synthesizing protein E
MPWLNAGGKRFPLDKEGFLNQKYHWTEDFSKEYARVLKIGLTDDHWRVIRFVRDYIQKYHIPPILKMVCHGTGFSEPDMQRMWGVKPMTNACRVAGVEKPTGCI